MNKIDFIIAYDISCPKRLQKISKIMIQKTFRIQKSLYLYKNSTKDSLCELLQNVVDHIDPKYDDVRAYRIKNGSISLNKAFDIDNILIFGS